MSEDRPSLCPASPASGIFDAIFDAIFDELWPAPLHGIFDRQKSAIAILIYSCICA